VAGAADTGGQAAVFSFVMAGVLLLMSACSSGTPRSPVTTTRATTDPPPAESGIDNTVSVTISLADSFDVLPDGKCAGRGHNNGMRESARVQLHGETDGGTTWTTAHVRFQPGPPTIYNGVKGHWLIDDGLYCIVTAVFAPAYPDPKSSYFIKFVDGIPLQVKVGNAPYGQLDRPGYGSANITVQTCRSLTDLPGKDCPEPGN
jgi:hypothetical protein